MFSDCDESCGSETVDGPFETFFEATCLGHGPLFKNFRDDFLEELSKHSETHEDNMTNNGGADAAQSRIGEHSVRIEASEGDERRESQRNGLDQKPGFITCQFEVWFTSDDTDGPPTPMIIVHFLCRPRFLRMWKVLIARSCDEPQTPGFGRAIDPEWVDLGLARRWKRDCLAQHKDKCRNPFTIDAVSPASVIDTALKCIVPGVNITEYVALSYRWGGSAGFRTTRHLLKDLQKPGALSQGSSPHPPACD
jgi:hypothetical protein